MPNKIIWLLSTSLQGHSFPGRGSTDWHVILHLVLFSAPNLRWLGRSSPNFDTCLMATRIYKTGSGIGGPSQNKFCDPETKIFWHSFGRLCNLIVSISGTKQDIIKRKTALPTAMSPAPQYLIWWTLIHKWRQIGPEFHLTNSLTKSDVSESFVRSVLYRCWSFYISFHSHNLMGGHFAGPCHLF